MRSSLEHATLIKILRVCSLLLLFFIILALCRLMPTTSLPVSLVRTATALPDGAKPGSTPPAAQPNSPVSTIPAQLTWTLDVIDDSPRVGVFSTLIQGKDGKQYAAYLDDTYDTLKLAMNNGIQWGAKTILSVDTSTGWYPSLAFDSAGILHVSVLNVDTQEILYGSMADNGSWSFTPAASGVFSSDTTLLFLPDGQPAIVFFDENSSELKFVLREGDQWSQPATISTANKDGRYFPAALDPQGQIHAVFAGSQGGLLYASVQSSRWEIEPIAKNPGAGFFPALAFDAQGTPHISYYDQDKHALAYAVKRDGRWQTEIVDSGGDVGQFTSIAVDGSGRVHISYFDVTNGALKYALRVGSQPWNLSIVDRQAKVGTWSSLALDLDGNPTISYNDEQNRILRYASADLGLSSAHRAKSITAIHHSGQTFLTWKEKADVQGEQYRIYRASSPIDARSLSGARLLYQVGKNSSVIWANYFVGDGIWNTRLTQRMVVENGAVPVRQGIGALVWTLAAEDFDGAASGTGYYAITITEPAGAETFLPGYTFGPLEEAVGDPDPVEISTSTAKAPGPGGHYYLQYMDLRHWNPTFHAPNSTNEYYGFDPKDPFIAGALAYTYDYAIFEPTPELCGGKVPDTLPVMIFLHGHRGNRYGTPDNYPYPYCAYGVYPIDQSETWWYGFARSHDYRKGTPVEASDVIENFTEQRVLRMLYDLIRKPPGPSAVDQQRIYLFGHSMGGTGSLAFAQRYPHVFAAIYSGQPVTLFRATQGVAERWPGLTAQIWGEQALNLPIAISAPNGWAAPLQKYNGNGVFDWENLPSAFDPNASPKRFASEMVPFGIDHGTIDDAVLFSSQGQPIYPLLVASPHTWAGAITKTTHQWSSFGSPLPNFAKVEEVPFYGFSVIRAETVPGLSHLSGNETGIPRDVTTYNQTLLWSASWNAWDGAPVDNPNEWQMSFCAVTPGAAKCGGGKTITVDITPRRLQRFLVTPGKTYAWQNIRISDRRVIAEGTITPDADGLLTIPGVEISPGGNRLRIVGQ